MTADQLLSDLAELGEPARAAAAAGQHRVERRYLGVPGPALEALARRLRAELPLAERLELARGLWASDIHEARILAAKLLTQARIAEDAGVWALILSWAPDFDGWAIADAACAAGERRLVADPRRLDEVADWLEAPSPWLRRAAMVIATPWAKMPNPKPLDLELREMLLAWATQLAQDGDGQVQRAVAVWIADLSRHDPDRARSWLEEEAGQLRQTMRREAARHLG